MAESKSDPWYITVAIDFGTSGTGFAYAYRKNPGEIYTEQEGLSPLPGTKTQTSVLLGEDHTTLLYFGTKAEQEFLDRPEEKGRYFFHLFKMCLYGDVKVRPLIKDALGRVLPAINVFTAALRHVKDVAVRRLRESTRGYIEETNIRWVVTVPAIWGAQAKQLMREAGRAAGMCMAGENQLLFAHEPEAAALCCCETESRVNGSFKPGTKFMVVDAGGGTVDIAVQECLGGGKVKMIGPAFGDNCGASCINNAFEGLLARIVGKDLLAEYKKKKAADFHEMMISFESRKLDTSPQDPKDRRIRIAPQMVVKKQDRTLEQAIAAAGLAGEISHVREDLKISHRQMMLLFKVCVERIVNLVRGRPELQQCSIVFLVGGFANSDVLRDALAAAVGRKLCRPPQPGFAVLKGAVKFGLDESVITSRVMTKTWGKSVRVPYTDEHRRDGRRRLQVPRNDGTFKSYCAAVFCPYVRAGDTVEFGRRITKTSSPIYHDQESMTSKIYSSLGCPKYTDTEDCFHEATITVPMPVPDGDLERRVITTFEFGATELRVTMYDETSHQERWCEIDFFGADMDTSDSDNETESE